MATIVFLAVYLILLIQLLIPVLFASIGGDDQHWVMETPAYTGGSVLGAVQWSFTDIPSQKPDNGRFAQLAYVLQRSIDVVTMNSAVALSVPPFVVRGVIKGVLIALEVVVLLGFTGAIRGRTRDGLILGLSRRAMYVMALLLPVVLVLGVNAEVRGTLNGWMDYPMLTYGAVIIVFGVAWLMLAMLRWLLGSFRWAIVPVVFLALSVGVLLNISYELFYLAFPAGLLVLFLQPTAHEVRSRWIAKAIIGGSFALSFIATFIATRLYVTQACANSDQCYAGVVPNFELGLLKTAVMNFVGSFPGPSIIALERMVEVAGSTAVIPQAFGFGALLIGIVLVLTVAALLLREHSGASVPTSANPAGNAGNMIDYSDSTALSVDRRILVVVALVAVLVSIGAAVLMAISGRAQDYVDATWIPYRNAPLTWAGVSLALVCLSSLMMVTLRQQGRALVAVAILVGIAATVSVTMPLNLFAAKVAKQAPLTVLVDEIHEEVAVGQLGERADTRRCAALKVFDAEYGGELHADRIVSGAYIAFSHYYGQDYCSEKIGRWNYVATTDF